MSIKAEKHWNCPTCTCLNPPDKNYGGLLTTNTNDIVERLDRRRQNSAVVGGVTIIPVPEFEFNETIDLIEQLQDESIVSELQYLCSQHLKRIAELEAELKNVEPLEDLEAVLRRLNKEYFGVGSIQYKQIEAILGDTND